MERRLAAVLAVLLLPAAVIARIGGGMTTYSFEKDKVGTAPAGFKSYATADGPPGKWVSGSNVPSPWPKNIERFCES